MSEPKRWYKPKLIEVSIPLEAISKESVAEKATYHGHPSALHPWWTRKPLSAARGVLFAQLVDDPSGHPEQFPTEEAQRDERERLHAIIKRLVVAENIRGETVLAEARAEIRNSCGEGPQPAILDPFVGGGSIALEAQRLGLPARASDLNPVAVLITKAVIEIPPRFAGRPPAFPGASSSRLSWPGVRGLAEDVRRYGQWMRDEAERRIGYLYPTARLPDGAHAKVIAWIWARTVRCPNPACAGITPLTSKFWLGKRKGKERWAEPIPSGKRVRFEIRGPQGEPPAGNVNRTGATCLICSTPMPLAYIRAEGQAGRMDTQLMAIAVERGRQRSYVAPNEEHEAAANTPRPDDLPDAELPDQALGFRIQGYGMRMWTDLFTSRQLSLLGTLTELVREVHKRAAADSGEQPYADAVATYLGLCVSKAAIFHCTQARWRPDSDKSAPGFGRQAIPMVWDFAEVSPFANAGGDWTGIVDGCASALEGLPTSQSGLVTQADAMSLSTTGVISTDPPYYDNASYGDLSDFFYIWLRLSLREVYGDLMATVLTPKAQELVADPFRRGGKEQAERFFENGFTEVFKRFCDHSDAHYPMTVFYAFKQAETDDDGRASTGWQTLLDGMLSAGWCVTATWPIQTEGSGRLRNINSNALASSIVLACRRRPADATVTDRRGLIAALRQELPVALRTLQQGAVAPVDLPQSAIGPGMAVFSRYARVNEPDGAAMRVRPALALINQVLDEVLSQQEGDFGADTRWCLEWFKSYGFEPGPFGVAETLSKAKNTSIAGLERAGVLTSRAGKVRLLSVRDLRADYDPDRDDRVSEWEIVLHLAKRLSEEGGDAAARLVAAARPVVDMDAVRELAYLLFSIAEKRGWADIALLFNGLGTSWSDLAEASRKLPATGSQVQGQLGFEPVEE
jgi:putative DNA methylase